MNFKKWLKDNAEVDCRYGDLLNDAKGDKSYPWNKSYDEQRNYLIRCGACDACLETFADAYDDYSRGWL